jgi:hypothetical protein
MDMVSNKIVNFDKLHEVTQGADENLALFVNRLQEALTQHTRLDPTSPARAAVLARHFISQSTPNIRTKLKKAEDGPQTPIQDLMKMAFKVFNAQEETAKSTRQKYLQQKVALQTQALVAALRRLDHSPKSKEEPKTSHQPLWGPALNVARKATGLASAPTQDLQLNPTQNANRWVTGDQIVLDKAYPLRLLVEGQPHQTSRSPTLWI